MPESSLAVTPGTGTNLRTNTRTISGTVHEQAVLQAEGSAATHTASIRGASLGTLAAHLLVLQADGTNYLRIRRITIQQVTVANAAAMADIQIFRSTTAGTTFGTTVTPVALDSGDAAYLGVCGSIPGVKGTIATTPLLQARFAVTNTAPLTNAYRWEWKAREDNSKSIVTGNGTASGIVVYNNLNLAATAPTVDIEVEFVVTSYL